MLFPTACAGCARPGSRLCAACTASLVPVGDVVPVPAGLDACVALVAYEGAGRGLVTALKYRHDRRLVRLLAPPLAALVHSVLDGSRLDDRSIALTWAPTSPARRRERGFDQAELLARAVGRELGLPARRLLWRAAGPPQTGAGAVERRSRRVDFAARRPGWPTVLLVDDVCTTGATLTGAARALRASGGERIVGLVVARTPLLADCTSSGRHKRPKNR